jgi:hypothetical protein
MERFLNFRFTCKVRYPRTEHMKPSLNGLQLLSSPHAFAIVDSNAPWSQASHREYPIVNQVPRDAEIRLYSHACLPAVPPGVLRANAYASTHLTHYKIT